MISLIIIYKINNIFQMTEKSKYLGYEFIKILHAKDSHHYRKSGDTALPPPLFPAVPIFAPDPPRDAAQNKNISHSLPVPANP